MKSFTVVPSFGGYFRSIKSIAEYSDVKIVLLQKKSVITVEGSGLEVVKYCEEDVFIKGSITGVAIE